MASRTTASNSVSNVERARESKRGRKKMESSAPYRGRAVRKAADRVLSVAAKGRTGWSRAILTNRKLKFMKSRRPRGAAKPATSRPPTMKVRVLGRLVPGCRKEALPEIPFIVPKSPLASPPPSYSCSTAR